VPETKINIFNTDHIAQCRNEAPFKAQIRIVGGKASIDCPHCGRRYFPRPVANDWFSDRPLIFLAEDEIEEARRRAT